MQINLNPTEINDAIKALLVQKGIDLQDKNVSFKFNNRRTKGGIFAVVSVESAAVVAPLEAVAALLAQSPVEYVLDPATEPVAVIQDVPTPTPEPVVETQPDPVPTVTSLFG